MWLNQPRGVETTAARPTRSQQRTNRRQLLLFRVHSRGSSTQPKSAKPQSDSDAIRAGMVRSRLRSDSMSRSSSWFMRVASAVNSAHLSSCAAKSGSPWRRARDAAPFSMLASTLLPPWSRRRMASTCLRSSPLTSSLGTSRSPIVSATTGPICRNDDSTTSRCLARAKISGLPPSIHQVAGTPLTRAISQSSPSTIGPLAPRSQRLRHQSLLYGGESGTVPMEDCEVRGALPRTDTRTGTFKIACSPTGRLLPGEISARSLERVDSAKALR